jgi:hypothetical protein
MVGKECSVSRVSLLTMEVLNKGINCIDSSATAK